MIEIRDLEFKKCISKRQIDRAVRKLAKQIDKDYQGKDLVVIGVLNGAFVFTSDLVKKLTLDPEILFLKYKSYKGTKTTGIVYKELELELDIAGRHVLLLEDIIDTGNTLEQIYTDLEKEEPASIQVCSLLLKPEVYKKEIAVNYIGMEIENSFVIGYGMDYEGLGRSLTDIYKLVE